MIGAHTSESVAGSSRDVASITDVLLLRAQFGKRWLVVEEHEEEGNTNLWQMPSFFLFMTHQGSSKLYSLLPD